MTIFKLYAQKNISQILRGRPTICLGYSIQKSAWQICCISILQLNVCISRKLQEKRPKLLFRAYEQEVAYDFIYPVNKLSNFCSICSVQPQYIRYRRQTDQRQTDATSLIKRLLPLNNDAAYIFIFSICEVYTTLNLAYNELFHSLCKRIGA